MFINLTQVRHNYDANTWDTSRLRVRVKSIEGLEEISARRREREFQGTPPQTAVHCYGEAYDVAESFEEVEALIAACPQGLFDVI